MGCRLPPSKKQEPLAETPTEYGYEGNGRKPDSASPREGGFASRQQGVGHRRSLQRPRLVGNGDQQEPLPLGVGGGVLGLNRHVDGSIPNRHVPNRMTAETVALQRDHDHGLPAVQGGGIPIEVGDEGLQSLVGCADGQDKGHRGQLVGGQGAGGYPQRWRIP